MDIAYQEKVIELDGPDGKRIHCVYNWIDPDAPLIIMVPQFEGTVRQNLLPMLYMINNGFSVLRFDFTDHCGNSDGTIEEFTLSAGLADLECVIEAVGGELPGTDAGLVLFTASMSSRLAFRHLSRGAGKVDVLLSLVGVVDVASTTKVVTGHDVRSLISDPEHRYGYGKAVKHVFNGDRWMRDLLDAKWAFVADAREEIDKMVTPTILIAAEADDWVDIDDYQVAFGGNPGILRETYRIPGAVHELHRNVRLLKIALAEATRSLRRFFALPAETDLAEPTLADLVRFNGGERKREAAYQKPDREARRPA